ncbi:MAG: superoxide dismutase [Gammaproteobacteria bacterium]
MPFELPPLPYALDALQPHISKETLEYHYGKHHQAYVTKLNALIAGTPYESQSLEDIIKQSSGPVFNNAAQVWNHTFYWHCMTPKPASKEPQGELAKAIEKTFGSFASFKEKFLQAGLNQFGSGWAWLVKTKTGELEIYSTSNAGTPMVDGKFALFTCDVWEHAYYIDTRNDRGKYLDNFWQVANWEFAEKNFKELG